MKIEGPGKIVRIYTGNSDRWQGKPLHTAIITRAKEEGLAGATVITGVEGFGANSRIHRAGLLDISTDLPVVVEIVDRADRIAAFLPILDEMVTEGLVLLQECEVIKYVHAPKRKE